MFKVSKRQYSTSEYPYSTDIPKYQLLEATEEEWSNINECFSNIDWDSLLLNKDLLYVTDCVIKKLEEGVQGSMKQRFNVKNKVMKNGQPYKSKNLIPREVRNLFRAKSKASKALKVVKSVKRCLSLRKRFASLDYDLKLSY